MRALYWHKAACVIVCITLATQLIAQTARSAIAAATGDAAALICTPYGNASDGAAAAAQELIDLFGAEEQAPAEDGEHCPLCVFAHSAALAVPAATPLVAPHRTDQTCIRFDPGHFRDATGPPLGQRAPPSFN
ncbi:MAG: DUF2946 family protein [Pseudomonadota bacterium]